MALRDAGGMGAMAAEMAFDLIEVSYHCPHAEQRRNTRLNREGQRVSLKILAMTARRCCRGFDELWVREVGNLWTTTQKKYDACSRPDGYPYWPVVAFAVAALAWLVTHHIAFRRLRSLHSLAPQERKVTAADVRMMFRNQSGLCNNPYCRADWRVTRFEVDHIAAKSRGGPDGIGNAQLLCGDCNQM